ncbi:30S ribosomal protein S15 [Nanohaloarchaea archaeon SG9]|nr:30S ribosomal protein S15 [Nanohaloarchaea archaeon SG9]
MTRMHSDGRGVSGSSKPVDAKQPEWIDYDAEEVKDLVVRLREDGFDPAQIGLKLRDEYGIPDVQQITEKKVTEILKEEDVAPEIPEDLKNLVEKAENMKEHLDENQNDQEAERQLELTEAKVRKVADYHRQEGNIPENWEYERDE